MGKVETFTTSLKEGNVALLRNRLPTKHESFLVFTTAFVIIYSWSTLAFFNYLPGWMLFLDTWTIAGIFAYSQVFALFESLLALLFLVVVAAALPGRLFRERFVAQGAVIVFLAAAGAIILQVTREIPLWPSKTLIFGILAFLLMVGILSWFVGKYESIKAGIEKLIDRLVLLFYVYAPFVAISFVIIMLRNIF